jgi:hypothetical protein
LRDLNLIESASEIWEEISKVNNLEIEFHKLDGKIPVMIARDVFAYPDKVYDFLQSLDYWETRNFSTNSIVRPGLTHQFAEPLFPFIAEGFTPGLSRLFGVNNLEPVDIYTSAYSGKMTLDATEGLCCYPHMDSDPYDSVQSGEGPCLVANLNLTKSIDPVKTGFWSWRGKTDFLDMDRKDKNTLTNFYNRHEDQTIDEWFQVHDYEDFKLESSADMVYNSLVLYFPGVLHNPYIKPEWFADDHRLMMSIFYTMSPEGLDFEERDAELVGAAWEHFKLDTLFNYHPQQTVPET